MKSFGRLEWGDWFYALLSGIISGTSIAGFSALTTGTSLKATLNLAAVAAAISALNFLRSKPLPPVEKVVETTTTELKNDAIVETKITTTEHVETAGSGGKTAPELNNGPTASEVK